MKKFGLVLLLVAAVGAAGYLTWDNYLSPKAKAIKLVKQSLVDPNSATFDEVRYVRWSGATCGRVNAKNKMGGYVGMTVFIVTRDGKVTLAPSSDPNSESGPLEARAKALEEWINFLESKKLCAVQKNEA